MEPETLRMAVLAADLAELLSEFLRDLPQITDPAKAPAARMRAEAVTKYVATRQGAVAVCGDTHDGAVCGMPPLHGGDIHQSPDGQSWSADPRLPEPAPPTDDVWYSLPGPPPTGRTVERGDRQWVRHGDGMFYTVGGPTRFDWAAILSGGRVRLVPLTDQEVATEALYGPVSARWGDPGTPCPFDGCVNLGLNHTGPHRDLFGTPLATDAVEILDRVVGMCTCGHPANHIPGCPRFPGFPRDHSVDQDQAGDPI